MYFYFHFSITSLPPPPLSPAPPRPPDTLSSLQVKARLHALEYLYDNSRLVLSTEQIKRLWACLGPGFSGPQASARVAGTGVGARATPGEVSTLLSWLSKACEACEGGGGGGMFEPGVAAELFEVGGRSGRYWCSDVTVGLVWVGWVGLGSAGLG